MNLGAEWFVVTFITYRSALWVDGRYSFGGGLKISPGTNYRRRVHSYENPSHGKRGIGLWFPKLVKDDPPYGAACEPTNNFVDNNRTATEAGKEYIQQQGILTV